MARPDIQTTFAMKAVSLAAQYNEVFGKVQIEPGYLTDMTAPDGPSTGGGVQAIQHIRLHSPQGVPPVVMGSLDANTLKGQLRSYAYVRSMHEKRSQLPFTLNRDQYEALLVRLQGFCVLMSYEVTIEEPPAEPVRKSSAPMTSMTVASAPTAGLDPFWKGFLLGMVVGVVSVVALAALLGVMR